MALSLFQDLYKKTTKPYIVALAGNPTWIAFSKER